MFRQPCLFVLKASLFGPRTTSSKRCCQAPEYTPSSYDKGWNGQGRNGAAQIGRSGEAGFHRLNPLYNRTDAGSKRYFRMGRECGEIQVIGDDPLARGRRKEGDFVQAGFSRRGVSRHRRVTIVGARLLRQYRGENLLRLYYTFLRARPNPVSLMASARRAVRRGRFPRPGFIAPPLV